ncbi:hypothetical protein CBR_g8199 [Chara braunii]|uniref:Uncharacterized protein n=1 Tax=Chara braunii TaxID=69332 RepID=A0A388KLM5_CHABU|nr:hypothetical protein CBR_g8199 [Chara braunii]|eukprot:GBG70898.1 hypothetical protein CBR_g8199 [Chara braunii]
MSMSPETHMRLAEPFPPCAKSVRHYNGCNWIHEATREDFEEDPWMTVVPHMKRHLDDWSDATWNAMKSDSPRASYYKFVNMLEFGNLITLPDGVLEHKFLNRQRKTLRCISRYGSRLDCNYITSSPRTWGSSRKQELEDCTRHCSFLEQYPLRCPEISPQARSYYGVRLTVAGCDFARVLFVTTSNKSRKLVDAVVRVSRNEVVLEGSKFVSLRYLGVDGWSDLGFGAGAVKTPFYQDLAVGGVVSAQEFFDLVEQRNMEDPRNVQGDQQLSLPLQMCTGFKSSSAPTDGGDLGYGPSSQLRRGEARGHFDNSDDEEQEKTRPLPLRRGDRSVLSIPGVEGHTPVRNRSSTSAGGEEEGVEQSAHKRRGGSQEEGAGSAKKHKARTPQTTGVERKGVEGQEGTSDRKRPTSVQKQPQPGALEAKGPIDVDSKYYLEWKNGVRTKREFFISPSWVVDIGDWEPSYNQQSLDPVHTQIIIDTMMMAFSQAEKTYKLPTLKLAPLGPEKPKPNVRADRLKPEDTKDELADQYDYYAVFDQHNAAAAKVLLGTDVALRYHFDR